LVDPERLVGFNEVGGSSTGPLEGSGGMVGGVGCTARRASGIGGSRGVGCWLVGWLRGAQRPEGSLVGLEVGEGWMESLLLWRDVCPREKILASGDM